MPERVKKANTEERRLLCCERVLAEEEAAAMPPAVMPPVVGLATAAPVLRASSALGELLLALVGCGDACGEEPQNEWRRGLPGVATWR